MKKILKFIVVFAFLALIVWTMIFLAKKNSTPKTNYSVEKAEYRDIIKKSVATGKVVPRKEIEIKPQVSGIIEKIYVEPGKKINKGDLIAKVRIIPNMVSLNNAESRLKQAEIALENSKINFERSKKLYENKVISEADYLKEKLNFQSVNEEFVSAENNLQLIREGATQKSGETTNTLIRSTISGMILDVPIEEGNSVIESNTFNAGTTIASVANMSEMIFEGTVDESEVGRINIGMELILKIGAIDGHQFKAILEYISPKGIEENGAVKFQTRASVELIDSVFIRAGYSANADIVLEKKENVLSIPEAFISFSNDSTFVEIQTNTPQIFYKKYIETGLSDGIYIEIISGITTEDFVKNPNTYSGFMGGRR